MESVRAMWNLFLFLSILTVPQLLGVLVYFRVRRYQRFVAHLVGFLTPPVLFFCHSWLFWLYLPQRAYPDDAYGMAALGAVIVILLGTIGQIAASLIAQLALRLWHREEIISITAK
jgi:hypothetical protein